TSAPSVFRRTSRRYPRSRPSRIAGRSVSSGVLGFRRERLVLDGAVAAEAIQVEVDDRRREEVHQLRDAEPPHDGEAERLAQLRAGAKAEGQRDRAEESSEGGHQDGTEAEQAGPA